MANIGSLVASLGVETSGLRGDMNRGRGIIKKGVTGINRALDSVRRNVFSIRSALLTMGGGLVAKQFIETASSFERLKLSLDTITKGAGEEWFNRLNEWAMRMPVNTEKAIQTFQQLRAMGLKPTIADMTTLVDATSALGGGADVMQGIGKALGQMQTKGKASAEELMQLAERGIPAYEILREKLQLTAKQVANIGNEGISGSKAVKALLEGMRERFGGMAERMQTAWSGLVETIKSQWTEFQRVLMDAGPFDFLKSMLSLISTEMDMVLKGQSTLAQDLGDNLTITFKRIIKGVALLKDAFWGLQLIWNLLKTGFLKFADLVWTGLNKIRTAVTKALESLNVMGVLDKQVAQSKKIQKEQMEVIMGLRQSIADLANEYVTLIDRESSYAQSDEFIKKIEANAVAMKKVQENATALLQATPEKPEATGTDTAAFIEKLEEQRKAYIEHLEFMAENSQVFGEVFGATAALWIENIGSMAQQMSEMILSLFESVSEGIGTTVADALVDGKSLVKGLKALATDALKFIIATLVKMGVQRLILSVLNKTAGISEHISRMGQLSAQTYAAAFASTAAIPIVGPGLAPGIAAGATAAMNAGSIAAGAAGAGIAGGQLHDGIDTVPKEGTYLLDQGERVVDSRLNDDLRAFLSGGGQTPVQVTLEIDGEVFARAIAPGIRAANADGVTFAAEESQ